MAAPLAGVAVAVALPLVFSGSFQRGILALMAAYAISAVGLNLLVGVAGQISLGHGAFMLIGGYTTASLVLKAGLPAWAGVAAGGLLAALVGFLLGLPALRLRGHFLALATLSFGTAIAQIALKWDAVTGGAMGLSPPKFASDLVAYWTIVGVLAVLVWVAHNLLGARPGRALLALRDSEVAAQAMGVDLARAKTGAFALAALYAGIGGALATHLSGFISPLDFNLLVSFQLLASVVVGGLGSLAGAILGAALITFLPFAFSRTQGWASAIEGAAIVGVVMFLPGGLRSALPTRRAARGGSAALADPVDQTTPPDSEMLDGSAASLSYPRLASARHDAMLLRVDDLTVSFGGVHALREVSFNVAAGTVHGLIGPNGAGKTTVLNCVSRLLEPDSGRITFDGHDLLALPPHRLVHAGMARTFQNLELCQRLSALDNVMLGLDHTAPVSPAAFALMLPAARRSEAAGRAAATELLARVGCASVADAAVGGLSYGVLKRIELARALACGGKLLILDEPAAGLDAAERHILAGLVRGLRDRGVTVLLVEHDMRLVMSLCDRLTVLDFGRVIADGTPGEAQQSPAVIAAYLGEEEVGRVGA